MLVLFCYVVITLSRLFVGIASKNTPVVVIEPNHLYCNQKLSNGHSMQYHLTKLQINTGYEFRISYPAVVPTDFLIKDLNTTTMTGRKLLNIEKLLFWTDMHKEKHFEVTALHTGVKTTSLNDLPVTSYDVVVEQLYHGVPMNVWKFVLFALITLFLVLTFCRQPFINYVNDGDEKLD